MLPIPPAVANQLEAGYRELKPHTETWNDELRCAIDVGPLGEEKVSHRLWPEDVEVLGNRDKQVVSDTRISTDPFCAASCFRGEAAAEGAIDPNLKAGTAAQQHRSYASYHVIYKDASKAFLLKPSLKPSAYYGRRPVAKIMKGMTIGIPVVRGFDRRAWERIHDKKAGRDAVTQPASSASDSPEAVGQDACAACQAQKERGQVTDLILVVHGIGQKFAERVESFHFTHAINAFRREVNLELANPAVKGVLREDQNGIMVLPINWRHTLSFEDGGPMTEEDKATHVPDGFSLKDIEPGSIPAVRSMISDVMFDIPFYLSHHKGKMIKALVTEANRVYRLWCRNNPGFAERGRTHVIGHSLGSAMAIEILSRQPTRVPRLDLSIGMPQLDFFEFDTNNLFLVGSPAGFFLLLERGMLQPRRGRVKPGADPVDINAPEVTGEAGRYGCIAVDNIYNVLAKEDPIAYLLNGTIDPVYATSLRTAHVPSSASSIFRYVGNAVKSLVPGTTPAPAAMAPPAAPKPSFVRLPSQLELEVHDFTREEIAERKAYLLNDNGQIDYYLRFGGGPLEIQYLNMLSAHTCYWTSQDFIRMLCMEIGRKPGRENTIPAMRAQKAAKRVALGERRKAGGGVSEPIVNLHQVIVKVVVHAVLVSTVGSVSITTDSGVFKFLDALQVHLLLVLHQVLVAPGAHTLLVLCPERLRHLLEEAPGAADGHVGAHVRVRVEQTLIDPLGELHALLLEPAVREDHDAVVVLASQDATQALRGVAHGVERQEVVLADAIRLAQELKPRLEDSGLGVLKRHAYAQHGSAVLVIEIDTFRDLSSGDAKQNGAAAVTTGRPVSSASDVSCASGVSTRMSLYFQTSSRMFMPCHMLMMDSMYRYDGKKTTMPSGVILANSFRTTLGSFLTWKLVEMEDWSLPRVTIIGRKDLLARVMLYDSCTTVENPSILGYISSGEIVPEVMMTELNLSKTGLIAMAASRHVKCSTGLGTSAVSDSNGSRISRKPFSYVATSVAKVATS
ncbi:LOW QUALITY PROTEIN: DDHD domain-containing protein [Colletotrichum tofieldiae]|nr:LOW QUALITY PROTEIN: DDHD domain-containing protein [Colletotrichum tofieldiae]GKT79011.1 LOW QUALITY PROTEIN: DDHD domain-containing protein [Colletotrichum tofieldiae]